MIEANDTRHLFSLLSTEFFKRSGVFLHLKCSGPKNIKRFRRAHDRRGGDPDELDPIAIFQIFRGDGLCCLAVQTANQIWHRGYNPSVMFGDKKFINLVANRPLIQKERRS